MKIDLTEWRQLTGLDESYYTKKPGQSYDDWISQGPPEDPLERWWEELYDSAEKFRRRLELNLLKIFGPVERRLQVKLLVVPQDYDDFQHGESEIVLRVQPFGENLAERGLLDQAENAFIAAVDDALTHAFDRDMDVSSEEFDGIDEDGETEVFLTVRLPDSTGRGRRGW
jgi:hypothetical protein